MGVDLKLYSVHDFPPLLREIKDAPKKIYVRGGLPSFEHKWLAVVGSRACTAYGDRVVKYLIDGLRGYPVVIVSGLAYGVDALAHRAAIDAGLPTVAVPGIGAQLECLVSQSERWPCPRDHFKRRLIAIGIRARH